MNFHVEIKDFADEDEEEEGEDTERDQDEDEEEEGEDADEDEVSLELHRKACSSLGLSPAMLEIIFDWAYL